MPYTIIYFFTCRKIEKKESKVLLFTNNRNGRNSTKVVALGVGDH